MERQELERWLCDRHSLPPYPSAIAEALGLPADELADTTLLRTAPRLRSLRFTLALLHDTFAADMDLWRWLESPRDELDGFTPRTALMLGREAFVEELAIQAWNETVSWLVLLRKLCDSCTLRLAFCTKPTRNCSRCFQ